MRTGVLQEQRVVRENSVFRWVEAHDSAGQRFIVQSIRCELTRLKIRRIGDYFERLSKLSHPNLMVPLEIRSDGEQGLRIVYPYYSEFLLQMAIEETPQQFLQWCKQAGQALEHLHMNMLVHGAVSPNSMVVVGGDLKLTDFGFAPLLAIGDDTALGVYPDYIAPETLETNALTSISDQYGCARTLAFCLPSVSKTEWYSRATSLNPSGRFLTIQAAIDELEATLGTVETVQMSGVGQIVGEIGSLGRVDHIEIEEAKRSYIKTDGGITQRVVSLPEPVGLPEHLSMVIDDGPTIRREAEAEQHETSVRENTNTYPQGVGSSFPEPTAPPIIIQREAPEVTEKEVETDVKVEQDVKKEVGKVVDKEEVDKEEVSKTELEKEVEQIQDANPWQRQANQNSSRLLLVLCLITLIVFSAIAFLVFKFVKL